MRKPVILFLVVGLAVGMAAHAQRDQIRIVGSSTVYPFATKVAEQFGR
ncbi:MAG: phosphate ABC transporter substrate-binding protein, partial [Thermoanaerobaculia bacterium]